MGYQRLEGGAVALGLLGGVGAPLLEAASAQLLLVAPDAFLPPLLGASLAPLFAGALVVSTFNQGVDRRLALLGGYVVLSWRWEVRRQARPPRSRRVSAEVRLPLGRWGGGRTPPAGAYRGCST